MGGYTGDNQYLAPGEAPTAVLPASQKKKRRMSGMSWIFIGLLVFFIGAAAFTALVAPIKKRSEVARERERPEIKSYFGVDEFNKTDEGVIFESVSAPGGPADKAGLVGGDAILSIDGQPINDDEQITDLMSRTPVGKTLEIEYLRDGEKKTTKLTTISLDDHRRLVKEFERRPEGKGQFGYDDDSVDTIPVPGTKIRGVILNEILNSRPADLAGIRNGDIVVSFDGVPIRHEQEFLMRVRRALPYSTVKVVVMRPKGEPPAEGQMPEFEKVEIPVKMGKQ
jgi:S1-C subfamily serine protease